MMHSETSRPQEIDESPSHRLDRVSVLLALVTLVLVGWTAWLRFSPATRPEPPAVGLALPPLRLLDLETAEPLVLLGVKGKVTWIVFWSAGSPSGKASLSKLEGVWKRLESHRRFTMVTAATNSDQPERVRAALAEIHATVPAYLAGPETLRRFGAELADPPLHLLVDGEGRIAALVRARVKTRSTALRRGSRAGSRRWRHREIRGSPKRTPRGDGTRQRIENTEELRTWVLDLAWQIRAARKAVTVPIPVNLTPGRPVPLI